MVHEENYKEVDYLGSTLITSNLVDVGRTFILEKTFPSENNLAAPQNVMYSKMNNTLHLVLSFYTQTLVVMVV